jgi:hypothetical protein
VHGCWFLPDAPRPPSSITFTTQKCMTLVCYLLDQLQNHQWWFWHTSVQEHCEACKEAESACETLVSAKSVVKISSVQYSPALCRGLFFHLFWPNLIKC